MKKCSQCDASAIVTVGGNALCVNCFAKFEQARQTYMTQLMQEMNHIVDTMEATWGLYGVLPRYKIPQPIIQHGPVTFNNIKVNNSIIGLINTGEAKRIDIAMDQIKNQGNQELVLALKEFTDAVLDDGSIEIVLKNQIIEQLAFLLSQSLLPKEKRKSGIIKGVLLGLKDAVSTVASLVVLWDKLYPLFANTFV